MCIPKIPVNNAGATIRHLPQCPGYNCQLNGSMPDSFLADRTLSGNGTAENVHCHGYRSQSEPVLTENGTLRIK